MGRRCQNKQSIGKSAMKSFLLLLLMATAAYGYSPASPQKVTSDDMTQLDGEQQGESMTMGKKQGDKCLCKAEKKRPVEEDELEKVLAAGWKKRAKKCAGGPASGATGPDGTPLDPVDPNCPKCPPPPPPDPNKCIKVKPRCEKKPDKEKPQCQTPKMTLAEREADVVAATQKAEERDKRDRLLEKATKAKCLSKFCDPENDLNRHRKGKPPTSMQCFDRCNKQHCVRVFDVSWDQWWMCMQSCVNSCFKFVA